MFIAYAAVVLEKASQDMLLEHVQDLIPDGWEKIAHHMTIILGSMTNAKKEYNLPQIFPLGERIPLKLTHVAQNNLAMAAVVDWPQHKNPHHKFFHITIAVNREEGGRPRDSNALKDVPFRAIEPLELYGIVEEVPQKPKADKTSS